MEATYEFALNGELIDFTLHHILEGRSTPPTLFHEVMIEKCHLVNYHFANTRDHLRIAANVTDTTSTITFYNNLIEYSKIKTVTITNTPDIEMQLVHLWCEIQRILKHYNEEDRVAEKTSLESYYNHYEYKQRLAELFTYEFKVVLMSSIPILLFYIPILSVI